MDAARSKANIAGLDLYYQLQYCPQDSSGACAALDQAAQRPWLEQIMYERLAFMVFLTNIGPCASPPPELTLETKPAWDAYYACLNDATENANQRTNQLLDVARNLGSNPLYSWVNSYGDQGTLSPGLWTQFYLNAWTRAKGPDPLPSFGFSLEVERITSGPTPKSDSDPAPLTGVTRKVLATPQTPRKIKQ